MASQELQVQVQVVAVQVRLEQRRLVEQGEQSKQVVQQVE